MNAIRVHEYGDATRLVYEDIPVPDPRPGEIRVRVAAVGLNFTEIYSRKGWYPQPLPFIPGSEFAGVVDALGEGVTDFKIGERVGTASGSCGYAGFALAPAALTVRIPDAVSLELAAAVLLQGMTAHYLACSTYPLKPGVTALVHAASGGVGLLLDQIGHMLGATLIGTVSTDEKAGLARQAGVDHIINYTQQDFETATRQLTGGQGVDVVYDSVGKATFAKSLNCLKPRGLMVLYGQSSGQVEPVDPQILNPKGSLFLTRPTLKHYLLTRQEFLWRANDLFDWIAAGKLSVRIDRTFPLAEAGQAQAYMEDRKTKGKVLILP